MRMMTELTTCFRTPEIPIRGMVLRLTNKAVNSNIGVITSHLISHHSQRFLHRKQQSKSFRNHWHLRGSYFTIDISEAATTLFVTLICRLLLINALKLLKTIRVLHISSSVIQIEWVENPLFRIMLSNFSYSISFPSYCWLANASLTSSLIFLLSARFNIFLPHFWWHFAHSVSHVCFFVLKKSKNWMNKGKEASHWEQKVNMSIVTDSIQPHNTSASPQTNFQQTKFFPSFSQNQI